MRRRNRLALLALGLIGCAAIARGAAAERSAPAHDPAPRQVGMAKAIRQLEALAQRDPENVSVQNKLARLYLERLREGANDDDLPAARRAAQASLAAVPAEANPGGLAALAAAEAASHNFAAAAEHAARLTTLVPHKSYAYELLGDALLEMGDYDAATEAYGRLEAFDEGNPTHAARLARLALLRGHVDDARRGYARSVELARALAPHEGHVLAWCLVQAGQLEFGTGRWAADEERYAAALAAQPDDWAAVDHVAELRAAQKHYDEAASLYQALDARIPRPELFQALGDVYLAAGKPGEAKHWHRRALDCYLEAAAAGNAHYYHHLSGYYTDVERNPAEAVKWARKDIEVRRSVYAYDALAWALHHAGEAAEAAEAADKAVALGTRDAHLLYHASLIYHRAGDAAKGAAYLRRAAEANPKFGEFHVHR